ncbi:MAG: hypothetical protein IJS47_03365 [Clostridia bacterium]|nr:hypothetical protein [Clostridia bacterium]
MSEIDVKEFIESTLIEELNKNNIFEGYLTVDQVREKLLRVVHKVEEKDLSKEELGGYWQSSTNYIAISSKLDSNEYKKVAIHELIHALVQDELNNAVTGIKRNENCRGLNEGITEWLTNKLLKGKTNEYTSFNVSFSIEGSYPMEQIMVKQIEHLYGKDMLIKAYINHENLDIPEFRTIADAFDHIDAKDSYIRNIRKGRKMSELSDEEKEQIILAKNNLENTFVDAQKIFLSKCLKPEIERVSTLEEADELKRKLKELNAIDINASLTDAKYEQYNDMFIRKYLEIVNRGKKPNEMVKFDDVAKEILSSSNVPQVIPKAKSLFERIKSKFFKEKETQFHETEFIPIDRGEDGILYIREWGEDLVDGVRLKNYQYLTEEEYQQYLQGDHEYKGELLKGNIDIKKLDDPTYARAVGQKLLSSQMIDERVLNYGGYIGHLDKYMQNAIDENVQERLEEKDKIQILHPKGYEKDYFGREQSMYLVKLEEKVGKDNLNKYCLMTKSSLEEYRAGERFNLGEVFTADIDSWKLRNDIAYREFIEKEFMTKERLDSRGGNLYLGEVRNTIVGPKNHMDYDFVEAQATHGAQGELCIGQGNNKYYLRELGTFANEHEDGKPLNVYEVITTDEMKEIRQDKSLYDKRRRPIIFGKPENMRTSPLLIDDALLDHNGYIGMDMEINKKYAQNNCIVNITSENKGFNFAEQYRLWENNGNQFLSVKGESALNNIYVPGKIDVERMNADFKYRKFVMNNILTGPNVSKFCTGKINGFEIIEKDGEFSLDMVEKQDRVAQRGSMEYEH